MPHAMLVALGWGRSKKDYNLLRECVLRLKGVDFKKKSTRCVAEIRSCLLGRTIRPKIDVVVRSGGKLLCMIGESRYRRARSSIYALMKP